MLSSGGVRLSGRASPNFTGRPPTHPALCCRFAALRPCPFPHFQLCIQNRSLRPLSSSFQNIERLNHIANFLQPLSTPPTSPRSILLSASRHPLHSTRLVLVIAPSPALSSSAHHFSPAVVIACAIGPCLHPLNPWSRSSRSPRARPPIASQVGAQHARRPCFTQSKADRAANPHPTPRAGSLAGNQHSTAHRTTFASTRAAPLWRLLLV